MFLQGWVTGMTPGQEGPKHCCCCCYCYCFLYCWYCCCNTKQHKVVTVATESVHHTTAAAVEWMFDLFIIIALNKLESHKILRDMIKLTDTLVETCFSRDEWHVWQQTGQEGPQHCCRCCYCYCYYTILLLILLMLLLQNQAIHSSK